MAPSSGGSALPRMQFWSEDGLGGPQPPSWSQRRSFVMGFWDADGEKLVQESLCFLAVVGDGGKLRQCSSSRGRLVSAVARRLRPGSQEFLDVVVKVEWHAWRSSWAWGLHAVSKYALAADDAAKTEQKHCTVATGNGADAVEEAIECAHGKAEGAAADGNGAAYEAAYLYSVNHLDDPIHRFNGEGAAYFLTMLGPCSINGSFIRVLHGRSGGVLIMFAGPAVPPRPALRGSTCFVRRPDRTWRVFNSLGGPAGSARLAPSNRSTPSSSALPGSAKPATLPAEMLATRSSTSRISAPAGLRLDTSNPWCRGGCVTSLRTRPALLQAGLLGRSAPVALSSLLLPRKCLGGLCRRVSKGLVYQCC